MTSYVMRVLKNRQSIIFIIILSLMPFIDLVQNFSFIKGGTTYHPAFGSFLAGSSQGHISQILLIWFLPLYLLLICADNYIQDYKTGYNHIIIAKIGKKAYFRDKLLFSFVFVFFMMMSIILINYFLSFIIFHGGTFTLSLSKDSFLGNWLPYNSYLHPYITYFIYIINFCILSGFTAMLSTACALLFPNYKFAYPLAFFIWFIQISGKTNLALIVQPFSETTFESFMLVWFRILLIIITISIVSYQFKVKTDEL